MRSQTILLAIPSVAMTVVGFALFGPGSIRPFDGAQIWGGPTVGLKKLSLRVAVIERMRGVDSMHDVGGVVVRMRAADGEERLAHCRTRPDATCDVELDFLHEIQGALSASVTTETDPLPLASGELVHASTWGAKPRPARLIHGNVTIAPRFARDLRVGFFARRGVFA